MAITEVKTKMMYTFSVRHVSANTIHARWYDEKKEPAVQVHLTFEPQKKRVVLKYFMCYAAVSLIYRKTTTEEQLVFLKGAAPATLKHLLKDVDKSWSLVLSMASNVCDVAIIHAKSSTGLHGYYAKLSFVDFITKEPYDQITTVGKCLDCITIRPEHAAILESKNC